MKKFLLSLTLLVASLTASAQHFITDAGYRQSVDSAFQAKMKLIGTKFYDLGGLKATEGEQEALRFLYAYMSVADATDYPTAYHLGNVRTAFRARQEMAWGTQVPEMLFRHFVLPMRVNNEPLDSFRQLYYEELKARVRGLSMRDAVLEVNHWCHEHVTYEPSDARTSSPLQSMRTAKGRCGEESTFAVSALRAIGIPARQVYTPRWAHTDDNHAWVEAWADGKWWFLGACEPEPVLNLGWFNAPASRALLTHTRAFGDYRGPEEVILKTSNFTEINVIGNYAQTARVDFLVLDQAGKPVDDAQVEFKIYNYAEYYTAVTKYTGRDGRTFLSAGLGDMLVWASKGGRYGFAKASFGKDKLVTIRLASDDASTLAAQELDIVPPPERARMPEVTPGQRAENDRRFAQEDSIRTAYTATFQTEEKLRGYKYPDAIPYIIKSRGNWRTIEAFLDRYADRHARAMALLATLSDKDLRDMQMPILADNMEAKSDQLCPRVEDEMVTRPFKRFFERQVSADLQRQWREDPQKLVSWIRANIALNPDSRAMRIPQTPWGVWQSRLTDARSRDIFFVDLCRSIGIEARKDVVTGKVQYRKPQTSVDGTTGATQLSKEAAQAASEGWVDVDFEKAEQKAARQGTLVLHYTPTKTIDNPKYYSHFTLSRIEDGRATLLNFDEGQVDMGGGTSWKNTFEKGQKLDAGTYLLVTGQRMADGSVLARNTIFRVEPGRETNVELAIRTSDEGVRVIGSFPSESRILKDGKEVSILSQTGRGYYVLGIIAPGQEPTNHALRDIAKVRQQLDQWGRPFVLLFESDADAAKYHPGDYGTLPARTTFGIDPGGKLLSAIHASKLIAQKSQLPVFMICDTFDRVVFVSQGYTIGLGEQLKKVADKL